MIQAAAKFVTRHSHVNWALADQSLVSGVNFLTGILLARFLGIEEFGRFTLAWMVVLFVNSLQHAVINAPMMSIGPKHSADDAPAYYGAVVIQQLIVGALVLILVMVGMEVAALIFPEWRIGGLGPPLATAALAFQFQDFLRRYFFTRGRAGSAFAIDALRYLGQLAMLFWLFQAYGAAMDSAAALWVIAAMAAAGTFLGAARMEAIQFSLATLQATTRRHWHFAKWLLGSALMQWTSSNLFILVAGVLLGATAVGAIRAAQNMMGITHILFQGLENVVPVRAAHHFQQGGKIALFTYLKHVAILGELGTATVAIVAAAAPQFWLSLLFGEEYAEYGYVLQWYAVIYVLLFLGLPLRAGLRAIEHTRPIFWAYVWMTGFSIAAAYPLIKFFEIHGIGAGLVVTYLAPLGILLYGLNKKLSTT